MLNEGNVADHNFKVAPNDVYVPVLDDPITPSEVSEQISKLRGNKACGSDRVLPSVLRLLPAHWITSIITLFNSVFLCGAYPLPWTSTKLFTIFKGGSRSLVNNYRCTQQPRKLYDMVLCSRLES